MKLNITRLQSNMANSAERTVLVSTPLEKLALQLTASTIPSTRDLFVQPPPPPPLVPSLINPLQESVVNKRGYPAICKMLPAPQLSSYPAIQLPAPSSQLPAPLD